VTKTCTGCGEVKPSSEYHKTTKTRSGLRSRCRACLASEQRDYLSRPEVKEKRRATDKIRYYRNREAKLAKRRANYDPVKVRTEKLLSKYGMTADDFDLVLAAQGGKCGVCASPEPRGKQAHWVVDHDHKCCPGEKSCGQCVRGILCRPCNLAIGNLADDPEKCISAASYLMSFENVLEPTNAAG